MTAGRTLVRESAPDGGTIHGSSALYRALDMESGAPSGPIREHLPIHSALDVRWGERTQLRVVSVDAQRRARAAAARHDRVVAWHDDNRFRATATAGTRQRSKQRIGDDADGRERGRHEPAPSLI